MILFHPKLLAVPNWRHSNQKHTIDTLPHSALRCFLFWLLLGLGFAGIARADTTFVSGAVSGTWTVEGSPYVIVDSSWVSPQSSLTLEPGVQVEFPGSHSKLVIEGTFTANGLLGDSVLIELEDDSSQFGLVFVQARSPALIFNYCKITGGGRFTPRAHRIIFDHCLLDISNYNWLFMDSDSIYVRYSVSRLFYSFRSDVIAENVGIFQEFFVESGSLLATAVHSLPGGGDIFYGITVASQFGGIDSVVVDCSDVRSIDVVHFANVQARPVRIRNTRVGEIYLAEPHNVTLSNCTVDSVSLVDCIVSMERCLVYGKISIRNLDQPSVLTCANNVFVWPHECRSAGAVYFDIDRERQTTLLLVNNVFVADDALCTVIRTFDDDNVIHPPAYNITYGMEDPWGGHALGPGNLNVDPRLDPNDFANGLRFDSPAIDAGDPALTDPDGTRSDIGAQFFDHRFNHPPIITTPNCIETRWGERLDLDLGVSDDGGATLQLIGRLPNWVMWQRTMDEIGLHIYHRVVPFGVETFEFGLVATDAQGLTDSEWVHVQIHPSSVLLDTTVGVLTTEFSPYTFSRDVIVPAGDSLMIEPGVHITPADSGCVPEIRVKGLLRAEGTVTDSIYFGRFADESWNGIYMVDSLSSLRADYCVFEGADQVLGFDHSDVSEVKHSRLRPFRTSLRTVFSWNRSDTLRLSRCSFVSDYSIGTLNVSLEVDSCEFPVSTRDEYVNFVQSSGFVGDCWFGATTHTAVSVVDSGDVLIFRNVFEYCGTGIRLFDSYFGDVRTDVWQNTFVANGTCVVLQDRTLAGHLRSMIANNIFVSSTRHVFTVGTDVDTARIQLLNNCFLDNDSLTQEPQPRWPDLGVLSQLNSNGDSTDAYANIFLSPEFSDTLFHLADNSPCVDAGIDVGLPYNGLAPDMGYWESNYTVTEPVVVAPPQALNWTMYPNPANASVVVDFGRVDAARRITLYNLLGQVVHEIDIGRLSSGQAQIDLSATRIATGIYVVKLNADGSATYKKLMVLK